MSNHRRVNLPKHINPDRARTASAPYNFVPLPEMVVTAVDSANDLPGHDLYYPDRHTGYFEVTLRTKSPLYVRCPLIIQEFLRQELEEDKNVSFRQQVKNTPHFFYTLDPNIPVIPGSSLRGMLRSLLEIASYGKVAWVTDSLPIFYRAVAAAKDDPLGEPYKKSLGKYGENVRAGYLSKSGNDWLVKPAKKPFDMGWPDRGSYLKIKEDDIPDGAVPGLLRLNSPQYRPQYHPVVFDPDFRKWKHGRFVAIRRIGSPQAGYSHRAILVCSGNMLETGNEETASPRKRHVLVLEADESVKPLKIKKQAIIDYLDALTPFQTEPPFDKFMGCLLDAQPIFYIEEQGEVLFFGHSPNFRVPAIFKDKNNKRAATPLDFVLPALRRPEEIDYADALFGFVRTRKDLDDMKERGVPEPSQGNKARAYAGRVFVTDATLSEDQTDIWFPQDPVITPKILAMPKPTAFQHYLVQKSDHKNTLRHYDSPTPSETVIRGQKGYWHQELSTERGLSLEQIRKMIEEDLDILRKMKEKEACGTPETQHTQFRPAKPGLIFKFRVYFENLCSRELGALSWILHPLGDERREGPPSSGYGQAIGNGLGKIGGGASFD